MDIIMVLPLLKLEDYEQIIYTVVKVDGATPKRWLCKGP